MCALMFVSHVTVISSPDVHSSVSFPFPVQVCLAIGQIQQRSGRRSVEQCDRARSELVGESGASGLLSVERAGRQEWSER